MTFFETRIVKTWEPSWGIRILLIIILLASGGTAYILKPENQWLFFLAHLFYMLSMFGALSQSFIKPKYLGNLSISEEMIQVDLHQGRKNFSVSEMTDLGFNYMGYASFWKHSIHGNKNHLYFRLSSGEKYDYEIVLENKEMKEELKSFLNKIQETGYLKIEKTGNYTF
ncbi:hypothetical protein [Christiangramia sp.]|uniref:hypothetical protein n=1 Tax=Christiangramia sp. TaxID=1931228 RepID=UPI00261C5DA7|nr:hypothetical protein [Christiangramia sp.]